MAEMLDVCLTSALTQSVRAEIIVCDGAGDTETARLIQSKSPGQILHLVASDSGVYDAMNKGIERAQGDWLYFIGADDHLANSTALEQLLSHAEESTSLVAGRVKNLPPRRRLVPEWHEPKWDGTFLLRNGIHHQGALYRKNLFEHYRYPVELKILGDYHFNLHLWHSGHEAKLTDVHVASCLQGGLSKRFKVSLYREEWWLKRDILPLGSTWWQPFWLTLKYLRKSLFS